MAGVGLKHCWCWAPYERWDWQGVCGAGVVLSHGQHLGPLAGLLGQERYFSRAAVGCCLQAHSLPLHCSSVCTTTGPKADVSGFSKENCV